MSSKSHVISYQKWMERKRQMYKQKEDTIKAVLESAEKNPKFKHLLNYAMNSLDGFLTPPNKEIRLNSSIIIALNGVNILRKISLVNLAHKDIITHVGSIIWKLLGVNNVIDQELIQMFADKDGQKFIIEILSKKEQMENPKEFVQALNALVQIPQVIAKLSESEMETVIKILNDDSQNIFINMETLLKLSNQKQGRDLLISAGYISKLIENINSCSNSKNEKSTIAGLQILDNLCREEQGKEEITKNGAIDCISNCLQKFEGNENVLRMCGKIISKIGTEEDLLQSLKNIKNSENSENFNDILKEANIICNLSLSVELCKLLSEPENFEILANYYNYICNIEIENKDENYVSKYIYLNKYFMTIFARIFENNENIFDSKKDLGKQYLTLINNIEHSSNKIWKKLSNINSSKNSDELYNNSLLHLFFFYLSNNIYILIQHYKTIKCEEDIQDDYLKNILFILNNIIKECHIYFDLNDQINYYATTLLIISERLSSISNKFKNEFTEAHISCYAYIMQLIEKNECNKILSNCLYFLYMLLLNNNDFKIKNINDIINKILPFMLNKHKYRYSSYKCLQILELFLTEDIIAQYLNENNNQKNDAEYDNCITSVLTSNISDNKKEIKEDVKLMLLNEEEEKNVEKYIKNLGEKLLSKLIRNSEFLDVLQNFKDIVTNIDNYRNNKEKMNYLNKYCSIIYSLLDIPEYYNKGVNDILSLNKTLIEKELKSNEFYKKDKDNENKPEFKDVININANRLTNELEIFIKILNSSEILKDYEKFSLALHSILYALSKTTDTSNVIILKNALENKAKFISTNEDKLTSQNQKDKITNKIISSILTCLKKFESNENIAKELMQCLIIYIKDNKLLCNSLVKEACPRCLTNIMDNSSNPAIIDLCLEILKQITFSNEENVITLSNQNISLKLFEVKSKFCFDKGISNKCEQIMMEITNLLGDDDVDLLNDTYKNFIENSKKDYNEEAKNMLSNIELINFFCTSPEEYDYLIKNEEFIKCLEEVTDKTINNKNLTQLNEKLLTNELILLTKIYNNSNRDNEQLMSKILEIIKNKYNLRNILLSATSQLISFLNNNTNDKCYNTILEKMDISFVDLLLKISDNYLNDSEVSKQINSILCLLCMKDEKKAEYIKKIGGLRIIIEDLKGVVMMNDENSKQVKTNLLKMISSLVYDEESINKFINLKGNSIINKIIENEISLYPSKSIQQNTLCQTENDIHFDHINQSSNLNNENYLNYTINIIKNGVEKGFNQFANEQTIINLVHLAHSKYPDVDLVREICNLCNHVPINEVNIETYFLLKLVLSIKTITLYEQPETNVSIDSLLLKLAPLLKDEYINTLKTNYFDEDLYLTYLSMLVSSKNEVKNIAKNLLPEIIELIRKYINKDNLSKGLIISVIKLINFVLENNKTEFNSDEIISKILNISKQYLVTSNSIFEIGYFTELKKLNEILGLKDSKNPELYSISYLKYLKNCLEFSLKYIEYYSNILAENKKYSLMLKEDKELLNILIDNLIYYFSTESDSDIKYSYSPKLCILLFNYANKILETIEIKNNERKEELEKVCKLLCTILSQKQSNSLQKNEVLMNALFKTLKQMKEKEDIEYFAKLVNTLCENIDNGCITFEPCFEQISNDLSNDKYIDININSLKALSKYPTGMKIILKNKDLYLKIRSLYEDENMSINNIKNRENLALLYNNIFKNSFNIDQIMIEDPKTFKVIEEKITNPKMLILSNEDLTTTEIDNLHLNIKDKNICQQLVDNNYINLDSIVNAVKEIKTDSSKINTKLDNLKYSFKDVSTSEKERSDYLEDKTQLAAITKSIDEAFNLHLKMVKEEEDNSSKTEKLETTEQIDNSDLLISVEKMLVDQPDEDISNKPNLENKSKEIKNDNINVNIKDKQSKKIAFCRQMTKVEDNDLTLEISSTLKKSRISIVTSYLLYNPNNDQIESPLSVFDNPFISANLDNLLSLIRLFDNENRICKDKELISERNESLLECFRLLKELTICRQNHVPIIEYGLLNYIDKISNDKTKNLPLYIAALNTLNNCTLSEKAVECLIESNVVTTLAKEISYLYSNPDIISNSNDWRNVFLNENLVLANICKCSKGSEIILKIIGIDNLNTIALKTANIDILTSIIKIISNYLNTVKIENVNDNIIDSFIQICHKGLTIKEMTYPLFTNSLDLYAELLEEKTVDKIINKIPLLSIILNYLRDYNNEINYIENIIYALSKLVLFKKEETSNLAESEILEQIVIKMNSYSNITNEVLQYSILIKNIVTDNPDAANKLGEFNAIYENIFGFINLCFNSIIRKNMLLEKKQTISLIENKDSHIELSNQCLINFLNILEWLSVNPKSCNMYRKLNFFSIIVSIIKDINRTYNIEAVLNSINGYLRYNKAETWTDSEINIIYGIIESIQKQYYTNVTIISKITSICGIVLKLLNSKIYNIKFYKLIIDNIKGLDWSVPLVLQSIDIIEKSLKKSSYIRLDIFDETFNICYSLLNVHFNNYIIVTSCYNILIDLSSDCMSKFEIVEVSEMLNNTLMCDQVVEDKDSSIKKCVYDFIKVFSNSVKFARLLLKNLIDFLLGGMSNVCYKKDMIIYAKILDLLIKHAITSEIFTDYGGIENLNTIIKNNTKNIEYLIVLLRNVKNVYRNNTRARDLFEESNIINTINEIIENSTNKRLKFEGKIIQKLFNYNINKQNKEKCYLNKLIDATDVKKEKYIKYDLRNEVIAGLKCKVISPKEKGKDKKKLFFFSNDLMKMHCQNEDKLLLPKSEKYTLETHTITRIVHGHGTKEFNKLKGLFHKIPDPSFCISIIGSYNNEPKSINIICESSLLAKEWCGKVEKIVNKIRKQINIKDRIFVEE